MKLWVFDPCAVEWQWMRAVATAFLLGYGHLGPTDGTMRAELVSWLARRRHLNGLGLLDPARVSELDAFGVIWSKNAGVWERGHACAAAFHRRHGRLAVAGLDDCAVGAWVRGCAVSARPQASPPTRGPESTSEGCLASWASRTPENGGVSSTSLSAVPSAVPRTVRVSVSDPFSGSVCGCVSR
ncbi:hypothetical protein ACIQF6_35980 [Kitasatospora sp. NPDC092948]|uniref:hypothetical protein n=1 Tax=Kitasatospora sp. NPDC092948 TaxID=3364088 RepID=UPI00381C6B18